MKKITKFVFDKAHYLIEGDDGRTVGLIMYYAENRYEVEGETSDLVRTLATDLLRKKHAKNFAYKFEEYTVK